MTAHNASSTPTGGIVQISMRKWSFLTITLLVFLTSAAVLGSLDALPNQFVTTSANAKQVGSVAKVAAFVPGEFPTHISIPSINLSGTVTNPISADADVLDQNLLKGAVRYPTSGLLGTPGSNVVVFGHSSYLPVVRNQAYKVFDGIQNLKAGDKILVTGKDHVYVYSVETVANATAGKDSIPLTVTGNKLTLVTCDSFKTKSDRFVVIASLVESYPVTN